MNQSHKPNSLGRPARGFLISAVKAALLAAVCAAVFMSGTGAAVAGGPIGNIIVKGGKNPGGNMKNVVIEFSPTEAWAYDPATGNVSPTAPEVAAKGEGIAIPGIGLVVKKNPGGGAAFVVPVKDGGGKLPAKLANGRYDLVVRIPQGSLPGEPRAGNGVEITFALSKTRAGIVHDGSPKAQVLAAGSPGDAVTVKSDEQAKPGSPIIGTVVRGGKNPGGNVNTVVIDPSTRAGAEPSRTIIDAKPSPTNPNPGRADNAKVKSPSAMNKGWDGTVKGKTTSDRDSKTKTSDQKNTKKDTKKDSKDCSREAMARGACKKT
jgi:hypothetical protein